MTTELAIRMAVKGGISVRQAREVEAELTRILGEVLLRDGEVQIHGFGAWMIQKRSARVWDPRKRKMVRRRERRVVRWKPAESLKKL